MSISKWFGRKDKASPAAAGEAEVARRTDIEESGGASDDPLERAKAVSERLEEAKNRHRSGDVAAAIEVYQDILAENPNHAEARHMVGVVAMQRGELEQAEQDFRAAIALADDRADYHNNLGSCLSRQGRTPEALNAFLKTVELAPSHLPARVNLCTALLDVGEFEGAIVAAREVLERVPNEPRAALNLGAALTHQGRLQEAISGLRASATVHPADVNLLITLASAQEMYNDLDDALDTIQAAERIAPDNPRVLLIAGVVFRRLGFLEQALEYLEKALALPVSEGSLAEAQHQLGLTLDGLDRPAEAFAAFSAANKQAAVAIDGVRVSPQRFITEVEQVREYFGAEKLAELSAIAGDDEGEPVFFVGFPRSGTTLMEQVLRAHRQVVTTEEISPLVSVLHEIRGAAGGYPQGLERLTTTDWQRLRRSFWGFAEQRLGDLSGRVLVDKLPLNVVHLGLAAVLFPRARIVLALRDPRDVVLSCFMQKFELNDAMANFLTLEDCITAYDQVMNLTRHYEEVLPLPFYRYRYEDLVANLEDTVGGVLRHIGLDWDVTLHGYREAARGNAVLTPSYRDVAAPVSNRAVARWERYQQLSTSEPGLVQHLAYWGYANQTSGTP